MTTRPDTPALRGAVAEVDDRGAPMRSFSSATAAFYVSATHKSSGKTLVTLGLARALAERGATVTPFKKGPDYIDAGWLGRAAGVACHNLDFNTQDADELGRTFARGADGVRLVEGTKGLHDGIATDGSDSNAAMADLLATPVVLVLDTRGLSRGVAALVAGLTLMEPQVAIAGAILNRTGGLRHEAKLRAALERYTDVPVFGALGELPELGIDQRHLGLVTAAESERVDLHLGRLGASVARAVDLERLLERCACAPFPAPSSADVEQQAVSVREERGETAGQWAALTGASPGRAARTGPETPTDGRTRPAADHEQRATGSSVHGGEPGTVRVGVPRDRAFCFYYPDDLDALRAAGAELVFFDALADPGLPSVDGLFIGGGFPERHLEAIEANRSLGLDVARHAADGLPVYAECAGLMTLSRTVSWQGRRSSLWGVLPLDITVRERPQGRGMVRLRETGRAPWGRLVPDGAEIRAHEFHYSHVHALPANLATAFDVLRGTGLDGCVDGIVQGNVLAGYAHLRNTRQCPWAARYVDWVRRVRAERAGERRSA